MSQTSPEELKVSLREKMQDAIKESGNFLLTKDYKIKHRCPSCSFSCSRIARLELHERKHLNGLSPEDRIIQENRMKEKYIPDNEGKIKYLEALKKLGEKIPIFDEEEAME